MFKYDKSYISKRASEFGFARDTLEKVYRLSDILEFLNTEPKLKGKLALKGGTAINLAIFNLPRLSVDIDLDYLINDSRDEMLQNREIINTTFERFMEIGGYKRDSFDLETAKKVVKDYLAELLVLTPSEKEFLDYFEKKKHIPQLLFDDPEIIKRIENHPMALWKTM
ncbi:MAG TPA: nucleotidyl transferase AbiEii/AbiGii toxin family protein [Acetivibrio sp.]|nr:nucleotidyl transferase AbiEii/AbiGii toxin family protein [Acetivibrio sp.]HOM03398.1 nucleotidyl transferase AbiEii/AbiGii toxin family protein [Acetivibrio sp.]